MEVSDQQFEAVIIQALNELPQKYIKDLSNVAIVFEDEPSKEQLQKLKLRCPQTLFGLYEGIPRTSRGAGYNLVLPDKITIFKNPVIEHSPDLPGLKAQVKHTLWHEIAHHFGLDHARIHELENR